MDWLCHCPALVAVFIAWIGSIISFIYCPLLGSLHGLFDVMVLQMRARLLDERGNLNSAEPPITPELMREMLEQHVSECDWMGG